MHNLPFNCFVKVIAVVLILASSTAVAAVDGKSFSDAEKMVLLRWLNQSLILVEQHYPEKKWLFNLERRQFRAHLKLPQYAQVAYSPNGKMMAIYDELNKSFYLNDVFDAHLTQIKAPQFTSDQKLTTRETSKTQSRILFWVNNHEFSLVQYDLHNGKLACLNYLTKRNGGKSRKYSSQWRQPPTCFNVYDLEGNPNRITRLRSNIYLVRSSMEGSGLIELIQWNEEPHIRTLSFPNLILGMSQISISIDESGKQLLISSSHELNPIGSVVNRGSVSKSQKNRLYKWNLANKKLLLQGYKPEKQSVVYAKKSLFAYYLKRKNEICVAKLSGEQFCRKSP